MIFYNKVDEPNSQRMENAETLTEQSKNLNLNYLNWMVFTTFLMNQWAKIQKRNKGSCTRNSFNPQPIFHHVFFWVRKCPESAYYCFHFRHLFSRIKCLISRLLCQSFI